ncbi:MAG: hypothetical protein ABW168_10275, partial [Sedimenticola sp.]
MVKSRQTQKAPSTKKPREEAFHNTQLSLFQNFVVNTDDESERLSNTIELWDAVPKYHISYRQQNSLREGAYLPAQRRSFVHRNKKFTVLIKPARLIFNDSEKECYPGASEELLEDVLRKLACDQELGFFVVVRSGVTFTIHMLKKELAARGHSRSYQQIHT